MSSMRKHADSSWDAAKPHGGSDLRRYSMGGDPPERHDQPINVSARIVKGQRRPHRALHSETPQDRLGAVMSGAHGYALLIERSADVFGPVAVQNEREHSRLLGRRSYELQSGNFL